MRSSDLKKIYLFENSLAEETEALAKAMVERLLSPGETLFREGDRPTAFYLIEFGTVQLRRQRRRRGEEALALGPGAVFGEMGWLGGMPRGAEASALVASKLWELPYQALERLQRESPGFAERVYRAMAVFLLGKLTHLSLDEAESMAAVARFI